jgi:hypothetical protein
MKKQNTWPGPSAASLNYGGRTSLLNPLWYLGALSIGFGAGKLGDTWSLGFLAETERQVEAHLDHHLSDLPWHDLKSRAIVEQMRLDEISHAATAVRLGARELTSRRKAGHATGIANHDSHGLLRLMGKSRTRLTNLRSPVAGEEPGGEAGNSGSMLPARRTIPACKPECALQVDEGGHDFHDPGNLHR